MTLNLASEWGIWLWGLYSFALAPFVGLGIIVAALGLIGMAGRTLASGRGGY